jgi:hypothetical protein
MWIQNICTILVALNALIGSILVVVPKTSKVYVVLSTVFTDIKGLSDAASKSGAKETK